MLESVEPHRERIESRRVILFSYTVDVLSAATSEECSVDHRLRALQNTLAPRQALASHLALHNKISSLSFCLRVGLSYMFCMGCDCSSSWIHKLYWIRIHYIRACRECALKY